MSDQRQPDDSFDLNQFRRTGGNGKKKTPIPKSKKEKIIRTVLAVVLIGVMLFSLTIGGFVIYVFNFIDSDINIDLNDLKLNCTTTILVQDDNEDWVEYQRLHGGENRIWIPLEEMPSNLQNAFIAIEDKRFLSHGGIDWKRTTAAFANYFLHFYSSNQGGSTITQQLVKNLTGDKEQDWQRKVREILRARNFEIQYSKETILECYLNVVSMANGISGVEVASNYYFDKSASELTLNECAALACITKNPESYRPDIYPENNKKRRDVVLDEMYSQGYISKEEHDSAVAEELVIAADATKMKESETNNYFVDALIDQVISDLQTTYNYSSEDASMMFYNSGYKIYTTMQPEAQEIVDKVFSDSDTYGLKASDGEQMQGAITVMDYKGHIVATAGGIGEKTTNRGFNRATSAIRQPGSTMKPIAAYAPAIDTNMVTYSTLVQDKYVKYGDWYPKNWYGGFWGTITIQRALESSVNTIPTFLVDEMTPQKSYQFLTETLGVKNLTQADSNYLGSLGMGGTNGGLTTTESAAAYAIFGNNGKYFKPTTYYKVTDSKDNVVLEYTEKGIQAIGPDSATVMNHLLQNVVYGSNGTGAGARSYIKNMKIFAKTGTSDATNDLWFVGGSPYYVASCWCGYDEHETIRQAGIAQRMWGKVMTPIHSSLEAKTFEDSQYASCRYYCRATGLLATTNCSSVGIGYYKNSYLPTCSMHGGKILSPISGGDDTITGESGVIKGEVKHTISIESPSSSAESSSEESSVASSSTAESSSTAPATE